MADYKNKIKALAERNRLATTDEERTAVTAEMNALRSEDEQAVSWRNISRTYFDKSVSWFQQKMYGIDGNGGVGGFTDKEKEQLRGALVDLSDRIRRAADNI